MERLQAETTSQVEAMNSVWSRARRCYLWAMLIGYMTMVVIVGTITFYEPLSLLSFVVTLSSANPFANPSQIRKCLVPSPRMAPSVYLPGWGTA